MAQYEGRTFLRAFITTILASILVVGLLALSPKIVRSQLVGLAVTTTPTGAKADPGAKPSTQAGGNTRQVATAANKSCQPASYKLPTSLAMAAMPDGVTTITDSPQYYTIGGATTEAILEQMRECAPGGEYAGQSGYNTSWYYGYAIEPTGRCVVVNAKVGVHLNMILPQWKSEAGVSGAVSAEWNRFSTALSGHEQGHQKISKNQASAMLAMLRGASASSCSMLKHNVQSQMDKMLAELQTAQESYDSKTNHGQTQGAELR